MLQMCVCLFACLSLHWFFVEVLAVATALGFGVPVGTVERPGREGELLQSSKPESLQGPGALSI